MMIPYLSPSWWRERRLQRQISAQAGEALRATVEAWQFYRSKVHFKPGVTIHDKLTAFLPPIMERYNRDFPVLVAHPQLAWQTIFAAISLSGTETAEDLDDLRGVLQILIDQ